MRVERENMRTHMETMMGEHMQRGLETSAATAQKVEDLENLIWKQNGLMNGMKDTIKDNIKQMEKERFRIEAALQAIHHVFTWSTDKSWKEEPLNP